MSEHSCGSKNPAHADLRAFVRAAALISAALMLMACSSVDAPHSEKSYAAPGANSGTATRKPQLKPDYVCQNMHVRLPTCPPR